MLSAVLGMVLRFIPRAPERTSWKEVRRQARFCECVVLGDYGGYVGEFGCGDGGGL